MMVNQKTIKVWDIFVRVFHWTLVLTVAGMYLTGEHLNGVHVRLGYLLVLLVGSRIVWGIIGTRHARFVDFVYGPTAVMVYLKSLLTGNPVHYRGHNPAGGWMVVVMLIALLITAYSGLKTLAAESKGPLAQNSAAMVATVYADDNYEEDDDDRHGHPSEKRMRKFWEEVHEAMTGVMAGLIAFHLLGVMVSSWLHKENLILAMLTGEKKVP